MINKTKTGLKNDTTKNMLFGAGVLYKNFSYGTHYKRTFDKTPQENKTYYQISGGTSGISYTEFTGDTFNATTGYYEKYEGYAEQSDENVDTLPIEIINMSKTV